MKEKVCLFCRKPVIGRSDKKFCDDGCRNAFHNRLNSLRPLSVRSVNNILSKNRRIISHIIFNMNTSKVSVQELMGMGFNFNYFTGQSFENEVIYHHCYEYLYAEEDEGQYTFIPIIK
jgi:hypothetical protein